jgi:3-hydroxyisobutyrate dehydrogenase-like beta-hydroxyacid dehydrogenase
MELFKILPGRIEVKKYGFLGLGIMGQAMAANLLKAEFEVSVWNRTPEKCEPLIKKGALQCRSPAEIVANSDITFAMVSDPAAARDLCFGRQGVLEGIAQGKGYVDVSTVDPQTSKEIGQAILIKEGRFLEAPVSGSKKPAEDGTLVFLCAGDEALYQEAMPALEVMGKKNLYFGETGNGAKMKLVINMIMGTMMTAFSEGLCLGEKAGLNMNDIINVLDQGAIANQMFRLKGPMMDEGSFHTAFPLKHMQKDMRLALQLGDEKGQALFTSGAANGSFLKARSKGFDDEDFSAVLQVIKD